MEAVLHCRRNAASKRNLISVVFAALLFLAPLSAPGEDSESIDTLRQMGKAFASIAEKASPAVVGIRADQVVTQERSATPDWPFGDPSFDDDFFEQFFGRRFRQQRPRQQERKAYRPVQGSGFIVSADGYILTNNHVVEDAENITVTLLDGREFQQAKLIGADPDTEVAMIKIDAENLDILELADSDNLEVGEWVIAIGNPFGLSHTVTAGIVSAKGRSGIIDELEYQDFIQTDAAINPGNSGGPLLNLDGKVVGINTAIINPHGITGNIGIGLAIPSNMATFVYDRLVKGEPLVRSVLGVVVSEIDGDLAKKLAVTDAEGLVVSEVVGDSAAEKAGIKRYDVIVELNGQKVDKIGQFKNKIAMQKPGTEVALVVVRDGKRQTITAKLGERTQDTEAYKTASQNLERIGFEVENLTEDLAKRLGFKGQTGAVVTRVEPGSQAARKGITAGMLIMEVDRKTVKTVEEFNDAMAEAVETGTVLLLVNDGRYRGLVVLNLTR